MNADPQPWLYLNEPLGELAKRRGVRLGLLLEQLAASCLILAAAAASFTCMSRCVSSPKGEASALVSFLSSLPPAAVSSLLLLLLLLLLVSTLLSLLLALSFSKSSFAQLMGDATTITTSGANYIFLHTKMD